MRALAGAGRRILIGEAAVVQAFLMAGVQQHGQEQRIVFFVVLGGQFVG